MSKYIDSEKLIAEIERYEKTAIDAYNPLGEDADFWHGKVVACEDLKTLVTSLQQEQLVNKDLGTLIACDIIEMTVKKVIDKQQDKEKEEELMTRKINYLRSLEENYVQQKQPEVDNQ